MPYSIESDGIGTITQFTRRKRIKLSHSGILSAYQIKLTIAYEAVMQANFNDIRFVNEAGAHCPCWVESKIDGLTADVWAKCDLVDGDTYIWMYYGNAGAASDWDGNATFQDFFEGFESVADWDYDSNYHASSYSFTAVDGIGDMRVNAVNNHHIVRYKKDCSFNTTNMRMLLRFKGDANTQIYMTTTGSERWRAAWYSSPSSYTVYDEAWNIDGVITIVKIHTKGLVSGTQHNYFDYMAFHKYASSPPTYAFGSEEHQRRIPQFM